MSLDAVHGQHSISPPSSGRSSPVPRATRRTVEDGLFKADKSLKRYAATIERTLATWEISPEEWADYIAFLGRLLKAIQTHPKDSPILPHCNAISTRLSQCLVPALPSGVHQKALEVYTYIFSTFGDQHIAAHLHEYLPGLSSVLSFASLSVRPALYGLFEDHIVHLSPEDLRPALKSLQLCLLPALEEESSEDFERAFEILRSLELLFSPDIHADALTQESDGYFWQCLFLAVISSPTRRQGVLNYLVRQLPKLSAVSSAQSNSGAQALSTQAECVVSPEPGLLVRCFVCALSDSQVLVQRGFLDLLVTHLPLDSPVLQRKVGKDDLDRLVSAATIVLLRRDMSLNRRLWSWFLGPEPKDVSSSSPSSSPTLERKKSGEAESNTQLRYFSNFGKASLQRCMLAMFAGPNKDPMSKARPYRICLSLMDRWEIGGLLVPEIFLPAMKSLYTYSSEASKRDVYEVIRSASLFFDGVEASLIWECLLGIVREAFERTSSAKDLLQLFDWIIASFNIKDEEMITIHIPLATLYMLIYLESTDLPDEVKVIAVKTASYLFGLIPSRALAAGKNGALDLSASRSQRVLDKSTLVRIVNIYRSQDLLTQAKQLLDIQLWYAMCQATCSLLIKALSHRSALLFTETMSLYQDLALKVNLKACFTHNALSQELLSAVQDALNDSTCLPFPMLSSIVTLAPMLGQGDVDDHSISGLALEDLSRLLAHQLWHYLSPEAPKFHVEASKAFWQLEGHISDNTILISALCDMVENSQSARHAANLSRADVVRNFIVLWGHSVQTETVKIIAGRRASAPSVSADSRQAARCLSVLEHPLLLVLDYLEHPCNPGFDAMRGWLQGLPSLDQIYLILFRQLNLCCTGIEQRLTSKIRDNTRQKQDDLRILIDTVRRFRGILVYGDTWALRCLQQTSVHLTEGSTEHDGLALLAESCTRLLFSSAHESEQLNSSLIAILDVLLSSAVASELRTLNLDDTLLEKLIVCIDGTHDVYQASILKLIQLSMKLRLIPNMLENGVEPHRQESVGTKRPSLVANTRASASKSSLSLVPSPPIRLFECLRIGFSSPRTRYNLDQWLAFLSDILPTFADALFTNLLPLVECFCRELSKVHREMQELSAVRGAEQAIAPESVATSLLEGLEMILDRAYQCLLVENEPESTVKEVESRPSFLSNVTSGVFKSEGPPSRTAKSNSRLTVILAFQDSLRTSLNIWLWASGPTGDAEQDSHSALTTAYNALKMRNKTRHVLEQIFSVEPLESLEVIMERWSHTTDDREAASTINLLHIMQVSRPKNVVPAILDALCSRTNHNALSPSRNSSLTIDLSPSDIATFFSAYVESTEDDAMDEIWPDCIAFVKDVLANPLPYRQVLSHLLSISLLLAEKLSNTNFGEQRKMRRELGDIFQRLLTATFTALPSEYATDVAADTMSNKSRHEINERSMTLVPVLGRIIAKLDLILETPERVGSAVKTITESLVSSTLHARLFPGNVNGEFLALVLQLSRKAPSAKSWKKEVTEALNDTRILSTQPKLMATGWFPILEQLSLHDKERMPEILSRLTPPTSAGIMFGVGASTARLEADRKSQLNLRRICLFLLASPEDTYASRLRPIEEKIAELFDASPASSPSSMIRAELFMLCRALQLSVTAYNLSPLWPIINDRLQAALMSLLPASRNSNDFNNLSLLQACKLLDLLVTTSPDEFQLHEWLYITDTIDAVYQPADWTASALTDHVAEALGSSTMDDSFVVPTPSGSAGSKRRPLLGEDLGVDKEDIKALPREDFARAVLRPFLSQLSIHTYEGLYSLESADRIALRENLLSDLLDLSTIVE